MSWVEILPGEAPTFRERRWDAARVFLDWEGILVNRHRDRQVEQVFLASGSNATGPSFVAVHPSPLSIGERSEQLPSFYLKKQTAVTWRERLRNAWDGFGWCATAVREAATLQALRRAGVGCPDVVALGEDGRRAFVLLRDEVGMSDLRAFLPTLTNEERRARLAATLGRELARLHDAGFDHPDLYAKHVLVSENGAGYRVSILDWQRSRHRRVVPWRVRVRDLAVLDATLHQTLASDRTRCRVLRTYLKTTAHADRPSLARAARQVRMKAVRLLRRRGIREIGQRALVPADQQFVPLHDGSLLVVRSYFEELGGRLPGWLDQLSAVATRMTSDVTFVAGASSTAMVQLRGWANQAAATELPPLAHTLFRLQRFGVPAPRLLAVSWSSSRVVAAVKLQGTIPFEDALADAPLARRRALLRKAGEMIRKIHDAGYRLPGGETWAQRLGVVPATGEVCLAQVEPLLRGRASWQELAAKELIRETVRLARSEQLCFWRAYLQGRGDPNARTGIHGNGLANARRESQVTK